MKKVWECTVSQYTGVEKPHAGFDPSVSFAQLNTMSEAQKRSRLKNRLKQRLDIKTRYNEAYNIWLMDLIQAYKNREFTLSDVIDNYENDAFEEIIIHYHSESPFRMRLNNNWVNLCVTI